MNNRGETSSGGAHGTVPSFFLVGASECGTTSMPACSGSHSEIFMFEPKELTFFCEDLPINEN